MMKIYYFACQYAILNMSLYYQLVPFMIYKIARRTLLELISTHKELIYNKVVGGQKRKQFANYTILIL